MTTSPAPPRELLLSVSAKDCTRQTFRAGGPGGQNQNKRDTGVRFIHEPSGARGEARDSRSQGENEKRAFHRLINSPKFKLWMQRTLAGEAAKEAERRRKVDAEMAPGNLKIEVRVKGAAGSRWIEEVEALAGGESEG